MKSNLFVILKNQAAPSAVLEKENAKYFDKLIALCQKCIDLCTTISDALNRTAKDEPINLQDMEGLLNLSAQLKDDLSSSFGELIAFETNAVYENMRKEITKATGKTAITDHWSIGRHLVPISIRLTFNKVKKSFFAGIFKACFIK